MRYLYGPVHSRRLGLSLGITLTPHKVCPFDCIYCQLGKTLIKTRKRQSYIKSNEIISELKEFLMSPALKSAAVDYISISGFGEPTLHSNIAHLIAEIKKLTLTPLALFTNAALFSDPKVRGDVLGADLLVPSLDAVTQGVFREIDRPAPGIKIEDVIKGLVALRKEFKAAIYLEIMLVKDINDSLEYSYKFKEVIDRINPDKIQLNTPVRSTSESWVMPPDKERLLQIKEILGPKCEVV
jgi:wyosine [tRNA(Phe)-imidazoG37] synthetase (radical SAM superfamily)